METRNLRDAATTSDFRGVAGQLVTAVSVVVTMADDEPLATTAGSVMAASWDPPLLAVLFQTGSRMDTALERCGRFTVNVLTETDHALARRFARPNRVSGWAALADVPLRRRDPLPPVLCHVVAWADCELTQVIPVGDHRCFVGKVVAAGRDDAAIPLVYYRGRFRGLGTAVAPASWTTMDAADLAAVW